MVCPSPAFVFGKDFEHYWVPYTLLLGEHCNDILNSPCCSADIEASAASSGVSEAIETELGLGNAVAFVGASNSGHAALHLACKYGAEWVLLASSAPLTQHVDLCNSLGALLVMTVCARERYFGGPRALGVG